MYKLADAIKRNRNKRILTGASIGAGLGLLATLVARGRIKKIIPNEVLNHPDQRDIKQALNLIVPINTTAGALPGAGAGYAYDRLKTRKNR